MSCLRIIVLLLVCFGPPSAFAGDYYWTLQGRVGAHPNPVSACKSLATTLEFKRADRISDTRFQCVWKNPDTGADYLQGSVSRSGDSCPGGGVYNSSIGECSNPPEPPQDCSAKANQATSWSLLRPNTDGLGPIEHLCKEGCRVALGTSRCEATGGDPPGICYGLGIFDGSDCIPGDISSGGNPPPKPDPDDPSKPPTCPPGWSLSGSGCFPNPEEPNTDPDPNNPDPNNPDPNNPNPGGGSGGGNGGDGGDGNGGDGNGNNDGGGDSGGGSGTDGGGDKPEGSVVGEDCDRVLACDWGDPIQCSILHQQKEIRCLSEKNSDYEGYKGKIDSLFTGSEFELDENTIEVPGFVQGASRFLPSSCPTPSSFNTSGGSFVVRYDALCEIASAFSWLFVAAAAFFAAIYVGKAFGGE